MGSGGTDAKTIQVDVVAASAPVVTLSVAPNAVTAGGSATLTWSASDATSCVASGNWSGDKATSGSASTGPLSATSAFALTCSGPGGSATQSVNVAVTVPALPAVSLAAVPSTVTAGDTSTLTWSSTNATACSATGGWSGSRDLSGSLQLTNLQSTATYTLTCSSANGSASQSATITVAPRGSTPPTVALTASPTTVAYGASSQLTWSATNATSCTASGGWLGSKAVSGTQATGSLTATQIYTLTCTGPGGTAAQSTQVQVAPAAVPTVSFTASPASVLAGNTTQLTWSTTGATSCTASGGWSGNKNTAGTETSTALAAATDFRLSCTGPGGAASQTVSVNVTQPVPIATLTVSPSALVQGSSAQLTWSSTSATSCTASGNWSGAKATSGGESTGILNTVQTYSYTLVCSGPGGTSAPRTATVLVSAAQPAPTVTISTNPAQVASGGTSVLTWSSANATSCTASGGWSGALALSGSRTVGPLTATTGYTITCTGNGTATASTTVVISTPSPTVSLTATPIAVTLGGTTTLNWNASNATTCTASGDWSGSRAVSGSLTTAALTEARTYSYALNCAGPGGSGSAAASVVVSAQPQAPVVSITPSPAQVGVNGSSTLTWSATNATSCTASGGWTGSKPVSGAQVTAALLQTTNYYLSCTGPGGTSSSVAKVAVTGSTPAAVFPLKVGSDGRRLVDQNGLPFLVVGDTPWSLITAITEAQVDSYLADRRSRGFNAIIVNIVEHQFNGPATRDGVLPFAKSGSTYDFSQPVEAYFAHVDRVLAKARDQGMLVLLTPAYLGYGGGVEGWWPEINTSVNTEQVMENYARYLGNRYRGYNNIVWVMGGDWYSTDALPKTRAIVRGLQATDQAGRLFTAHNARQQSAADTYNDESWLTVNTTYSECSQTAQRSIIDYQRAKVRPFVFFEGRYENEGDWSLKCLHSQAYWPVLLGSFGSYFGNKPMWLFDSGWESALSSAGAQGMTYYGKLFRSRNWSLLVPDLASGVLTAGQGSGVDYAAAARASDGSSFIVYTPTQRSLTVDLRQVAGSQARAWWFNPSTGAATDLGSYATTGPMSFTPPATGDWVLVVDDAALALTAPGQ